MRGNERDEDMAQSQELLAPEVRAPVDAQRKTPEDPPNPPLKDDVPQLSSPVPLERIQAAMLDLLKRVKPDARIGASAH